jgi:RTX calcium-binding nonapeptide repeat (4 copies)
MPSLLPETNLDDVIRGWAEDGDPSTDLGDVLRGFDGNDRLFGGDGTGLSGYSDELSGGNGEDTLDGGGGRSRPLAHAGEPLGSPRTGDRGPEGPN